MTETFVVALTSFLATVGRVDVAARFAALRTPPASSASWRGALIAIAAALPLSALVGRPLLHLLGIS